jgi:hypothetical protein
MNIFIKKGKITIKRIIKQVLMLFFVLGSLQVPILAMEKEKFDLKINIYKDPLTALYESGNGSSYLYIPEKDLIDSNGQPIDLKKLFETNSIHAIASMVNQPWSTKGWEMAYKIFSDAKYNMWNMLKTFYTLDELLKLLAEAKIVIKSFLPVDNFSFIFTQIGRAHV